MRKLRFFVLLLLLFSFVLDRDASDDSILLAVNPGTTQRNRPMHFPVSFTPYTPTEPAFQAGKGALLSTRFTSFDELKTLIQIDYLNVSPSGYAKNRKPLVRLTHTSNGRTVTSILKSGVSEVDFAAAQRGGFWDRVGLALKAPYVLFNRVDMLRVMILSRRRPNIYREGDVAFFDLAETMVQNINEDDVAQLDPKDLSEKGFLNTFNHVTAQTFMTAIFSERFADFIADSHERYNMPELISGQFTEAQRSDLALGPVDNYVDVINNEWGQELGKALQKRYNLNYDTYWTPELLTRYLNDVQRYYSWAFQIGFRPFKPTDELIIRFSSKLNRVMEDVSGLR